MIRQQTDKWFRTKALCFGATDVASLLGHGYQKPDQVINDKINCVDSRTRVLDPTFKYLVERGKRYESVVNSLFQDRHGVKVKETGLKRLHGHFWQTASPDGIYGKGVDKCLLEFKVKRNLSENVPYKHWIQMQTQMAVWGIKQCLYCQNVIQEFETAGEYSSEINKFAGTENSNGILEEDGTAYYWRLNEYKETLVQFDATFWNKTLNETLIPTWSTVETGRNGKFVSGRTRSKHSKHSKHSKRSKRKRTLSEPYEPSAKKAHTTRSDDMDTDDDKDSDRLVVMPYMFNNWFRKDPLLDWLNLYGDHTKKSFSANPFLDMIRVKNYEFGSVAKTYIKHKYKNMPGFLMDIDRMGPEDFIGSFRSQANIEPDQLKVSQLAVQRTSEAIKKCYPIILNACFSVPVGEYQFEGVADMLVLNAYLNQVFGGDYASGQDDKYSIVKLKFATINLKADGTHMLNNDKQKVYKAQLWLLNSALAVEQEYLNPHAYVVGRKYEFTKCKVKNRFNSAFGKLGVVDFSNDGSDTQYNIMASEALDWFARVRHPDMKHMDPMEPGDDNLFPNMKNHSDFPWTDYKKEIAENIKDITLMYKCGPKVRNFAMEEGITEWTELDVGTIVYQGDTVLSQIMGFVDSNKKDQPSAMAGKGIFKKTDLPCMEFYIDFEAVGNMYDDFSKFPEPSNYAQIFLIGAVIVDNVKGETYACSYLVNKLSKEAEKEMVLDMFKDFHKMCEPYNQDYLPLIFWGNAEKYMLERVLGADGLQEHKPILIDMCKIFRESQIIFPGQFGYGLKQVAKTMHKAGYIQTLWKDGDEITNGISAMSEGLRHLKDGQSEVGRKFFKDVIEYNYIDCKVIHEIIAFFRTR